MIHQVHDKRASGTGRAPIGVTVRVWGWDDARIDCERELIDRVCGIVAEYFYFGLETSDIEDDVVSSSGGIFCDADITATEQGEFEVTLLPAECGP